MTTSPFTKNGERVYDLMKFVHPDVRGPMSLTYRNGYRYFITFIDDLFDMNISL
jgi:hypothetical protein